MRRFKCRRRELRVFRRGDYGWLTRCLQPKRWQPNLKLLANITPPTFDPSRSRALTEKEPPRPILRRAPRCNTAEYNPQRSDLPPEMNNLPGPKYDSPPGAFGRTGGGGGTVAPCASVSALDRFPRRRLFPEEEMREREATPGPEAYDVALEHRLEGAALEVMKRSLGTLASLGGVEFEMPGSLMFAAAEGGDRDAELQENFSPRRRMAAGSHGVPSVGRFLKGGLSSGGCSGCIGHEMLSKINGRSYRPCSAGCHVKRSVERSVIAPRVWRSRCSRLAPAATEPVAAERRKLCRECLERKLASAADKFLAATSSLLNPNIMKRAQTVGASMCFGDVPKLNRAPTFTIGGEEARDVPSRLLDIPGETIFRGVRLGRSVPGPYTGKPLTGERLTGPRFRETKITPHGARSGRHMFGSKTESLGGSGLTGTGTKAVAEMARATKGEGVWVVDGALGAQVKSGRPTIPSFTHAGPRRAADLFHERLRYGGKVCSD